VNRYLLYGEDPAPGSTCSQDWSPFPTSSAPNGAAAEARIAARAVVMRQIAPLGAMLGSG
jgi:hypothetical protein